MSKTLEKTRNVSGWAFGCWLLLIGLTGPAIAEEPLTRGRQLIETGNYAEAVAVLRQASLDNPAHLETTRALAQAAFAQGDYETAAMVFERLLMLVPESGLTRLDLARTFAKLKTLPLARQYLLHLLDGQPGPDARTLLQQAATGLESGDSAPLFAHFDQLSKLLQQPLPTLAAEQGEPPAREDTGISHPPAGKVVALRGQALARNPWSDERALRMTSEIFAGDRITTSSGSRLQLVFSDNTIVSLGPDAELVIDTYRWNAQNQSGAMQTQVEKGLFRVLGGLITQAAPEKFSTETPAATIGIRGSIYAGFYNDETGALQVALLGGKGVFVGNALGRSDIERPGLGVATERGRAPSAALPLSDNQLALLAEGLMDDLILHHKAANCLDDYSVAFAETPYDCDQTCFSCHRNDEIVQIANQQQNPQGQRTDEAYPGLYPTAEPISKDNSYEQNWAALPTLHKVCRDCHTALAIDHGNHPIFENVVASEPAGDDQLQVVEGMLLCTTCHNPHLEDTALLRASNMGSRVCLACHTGK